MIWYLIYLTGFLFTSRLVWRGFENDELFAPEDGFDSAMVGFLTIVISLFWPIILVGFILKRWWTFDISDAALKRSLKKEG